MSNKEWLLNAAAIKVARRCIKIVDEELGVRLTLSHPDFLSLLEQYSQLTDSSALVAAVRELYAYASPAVAEKHNVISIGERLASRTFGHSSSEKPLQQRKPLGLVDTKTKGRTKNLSALVDSAQTDSTSLERRVRFPERRGEVVPYHGKKYARWNGGKEFQGLYRGHPRYA